MGRLAHPRFDGTRYEKSYCGRSNDANLAVCRDIFAAISGSLEFNWCDGFDPGSSRIRELFGKNAKDSLKSFMDRTDFRLGIYDKMSGELVAFAIQIVQNDGENLGQESILVALDSSVIQDKELPLWMVHKLLKKTGANMKSNLTYLLKKQVLLYSGSPEKFLFELLRISRNPDHAEQNEIRKQIKSSPLLSSY